MSQETPLEPPALSDEDAETLLARLELLGETALAVGGLKPGGCCVFAAITGLELAKKGVPVWGVVATVDPTPLSIDQHRPEDRFSVAAWSNNGLSLSHVGLEFDLSGKTWLYDAAGLIERNEDARILPCVPEAALVPGWLSLEEVVRLSLDDSNGAWVADFDRRHIPTLRRLAAEMLCI